MPAPVPVTVRDKEREALVMRMYERCEWYELALMRHGFSVERLMRLARKIANDAIRTRGGVPSHWFEDLVSRLQLAGLQLALRYDPQRQSKYGSNGGDPFGSYVADVMDKRVDDFFRSKSEGFGDRRYGNDGRIVLVDDPDPADHDTDFDELVDDRRRARWQQAAEATGWSLSEWIAITLDRAAASILREAA